MIREYCEGGVKVGANTLYRFARCIYIVETNTGSQPVPNRPAIGLVPQNGAEDSRLLLLPHSPKLFPQQAE